jgi:P4 family phage/plasmid primase-like protien
MKKLKPVPKEMMAFKQFLHGKEPVCWQSFQKLPDGTANGKLLYGNFSPTIRKQLVAENDAGRNIGMLIQKSGGKGRKKEDIVAVFWLFADLDGKNWTVKKLSVLPIPPDLIIQTSPNKYHVYWRIKGCSLEQYQSVMKALAELLGGDPVVCDLVRVMRVPGTINLKYETPFLAKILYKNADVKPVFINSFIEKMGLVVNVTKAAKGNDVVSQSAPPDELMLAHVKEALEYVCADDRDIWRRVGMAIHSWNQSNLAYTLWTEWSKSSEKFDETEQSKTWSKFKPGGGVNIETLFWLARAARFAAEGDFDEMSLADLFASTYKERLGYDRENRVWIGYENIIWKQDAQAPLRLVRKMIQELSADAANANSIKRFRSAGAMRSIVNQAELDDELNISSNQFDTNPNLLAVLNGVVDLSAGTFRTATPSDMLLRQAGVVFDETATCPVWEKFMEEVTCGDSELLEFIRRGLGYTLFGHADLQIFFMLVGLGSNGKGVLMRTLKKLLGKYAENVAPNLLISAYDGSANAATPALAKLAGARLAICTELPTRRRFDEAFIKNFSGGDELTVRNTYGAVFTYKPVGVLWLSTNEVPEIDAANKAMWRRIVPIPFNATFSGKDVDPKLEDKLALEFSGILNWLLEGAQSFHAQGLGSCSAVKELKLNLRKDADSLLAWTTECCVSSPKAETPAREAYDNYKAFMRTTDRKALGQPAFRAGLTHKGFEHKRNAKHNLYAGFRLRG